jgi:hypothetical protein
MFHLLGLKRLLHSFAMVILLAGCRTTEQRVSFVGSYQGSPTERSTSSGESLVEQLVVVERTDGYALQGFMNDTNWEPGMDGVSNTRWRWEGQGKVRDGVLEFSYEGPDGGTKTGSLRQEQTSFLLTLDQGRYRLSRTSK